MLVLVRLDNLLEAQLRAEETEFRFQPRGEERIQRAVEGGFFSPVTVLRKLHVPVNGLQALRDDGYDDRSAERFIFSKPTECRHRVLPIDGQFDQRAMRQNFPDGRGVQPQLHS